MQNFQNLIKTLPLVAPLGFLSFQQVFILIKEHVVHSILESLRF